MIAKFTLLFVSLFTALIVKTHILAGIYFIFLKKCPNQIWTAVKRLEK